MRPLYIVGWSFTLLGLVIVLIATIRFMILDEEIRNEVLMAHEQWRAVRLEELDRKRAQLNVWPLVGVGSGVTLLGLAVLEYRRRVGVR
ncbi:MAG TPA: hypothetical protein VML54_00430 [Candidatus Limnocylindrales bacterium]|nr:hypothetical protein [Candidatus Limnocylindrales bacterium]